MKLARHDQARPSLELGNESEADHGVWRVYPEQGRAIAKSRKLVFQRKSFFRSKRLAGRQSMCLGRECQNNCSKGPYELSFKAELFPRSNG